MYSETGCDGLMIGRGALQDPLLFRRIKEHFTGQTSCHAHLGDCHSTRQNADCTSSVRTSPETCQHKSFVGAATFEANVRECELVATFLRRYAAYGFDGSINGAAQSLVSLLCGHDVYDSNYPCNLQVASRVSKFGTDSGAGARDVHVYRAGKCITPSN